MTNEDEKYKKKDSVHKERTFIAFIDVTKKLRGNKKKRKDKQGDRVHKWCQGDQNESKNLTSATIEHDTMTNIQENPPQKEEKPLYAN